MTGAHAPTGAQLIEMIGRGEQVAIIRERLRVASEGRLQTVLIEGEPGIGKTLLLEHALTAAVSDGFRHLRVRCEELMAGRPFGPLIDALDLRTDSPDERRAAIAAELGQRPEDRFGAVHFRVADRIAELFEGDALDLPLIVAVDDLHWADTSTLYTLAMLPHRTPWVPVVLIGAMRFRPRSRELERLIEIAIAEGGTCLRLEALDDHDVAGLVERRVGATPGAGLIRQVDRAGGNPLLIRELVDALMRDESVAISDGVAESSDVEVPSDLRLTILRTVSGLSENTVRALRVASVLGSRFSPSELAAVMQRSVIDLGPSIEEGLASAVLVERGHEVAFRHDLIRETLYGDIPEPLRRGIHREIATVFHREHASPARTAEHFILGAGPHDPQAVATIRHAARMPSLAPSARVDLLRRGFDLLAAGTTEQDAIGADLADALIWAGNPQEGVSLARDLLRRHNDDEFTRNLWLSVLRACYVAGRWEEIIAFTTERLALESMTASDRATLLAYRASALAFGRIATTEAAHDAEVALAWAEKNDDDAVRVLALQGLEKAAAFEFRNHDALRYSERAFDVSESSGDSDVLRLYSGATYGQLLRAEGRHEDGIRLLRDGLRTRQEEGRVWDLSAYHHSLASLYIDLGRFDDALATVEASLAAADEYGTRFTEARSRNYVIEIMFARGDLDEVERQLALIEAIELEFGTADAWWADARGYRAALLAARGATADALLLIADLIEADPRMVRNHLIDWMPTIYESGNIELARAAVRKANQSHQVVSDGRILACAGLVEGSADMTRAAVAALEAEPFWVSSIAKELAGWVLAEQGDTEEARVFFRAALEHYDALGADRLRARAGAKMRTFGLTPGRRTVSHRPSTGWDSLTVAEQRVARLAAQGSTNAEVADRLFVSRHTVQTHMKHIFAKLCITSRVQLATEVANHQRH